MSKIDLHHITASFRLIKRLPSSVYPRESFKTAVFAGLKMAGTGRQTVLRLKMQLKYFVQTAKEPFLFKVMMLKHLIEPRLTLTVRSLEQVAKRLP